MAPSMLNFAVEVSAPELIKPEKPTPIELKYLSNIDDQNGLRNHIPFVHFYPQTMDPNNHHHEDPVLMIKHALSKVLVYYYPVAGRLRNGDGGKLVVDCCGEGVVFRGGEANIKLAELCDNGCGGLKPPFPKWNELLVDDIWGSNLITNSPLLRMQVTKFACGGFALAYTFNHCICDAYGAYQFIKAVSEFCTKPNRTEPSQLPDWGREALKPRSPPKVSHHHIEYETSEQSPAISYSESQFKNLAQTSIFFSNKDISHLKNQPRSQKLPTFDAIAACLWRARTRTLLSPASTARLLFPIDTRFRNKPSLPKGYYGSAVVFPCAIAKASELCEKPLSYAAGLISSVKNAVGEDEYRASVLDFIQWNGRRGFRSDGSFVVSDMTRLRFGELDFGWGKGVYGGPSRAGTGLVPGMVASLVTHVNTEGGGVGILALVSLPHEFVDRFHKEVRKEIDCCAAAAGKLVSAL